MLKVESVVLLLEIPLPTRFYVFPVNPDIIISVASHMFVPHSQTVSDLVNWNCELHNEQTNQPYTTMTRSDHEQNATEIKQLLRRSKWSLRRYAWPVYNFDWWNVFIFIYHSVFISLLHYVQSLLTKNVTCNVYVSILPFFFVKGVFCHGTDRQTYGFTIARTLCHDAM